MSTLRTSGKGRKKTLWGAEELDALLREALSLHQQDKLHEAKALYLKVLKQQPDNADALHLSGLIAHQQEKFPEADRRISRAIKCDDSQPIFYSNLGAVRRARGLLEDAHTLYLAALNLDPSHAESHNNLGNIYQERNQPDKAELHYRQAIQTNPDYAEAIYNLGVSYFRKDCYEEAIKCQQRVLELNPNYADALIALGCVHVKTKEFSSAVIVFEKAIVINPDSAEAYLELGAALMAQSDIEGAVKALKKVVQLGDTSLSALHVLATAEHLLAGLQGTASDSSPESYIEQLFDGYSSNFEEHLTRDLEYKTPEVLHELVIQNFAGINFNNALDLGCGTGLAGEVFRASVQQIDGVDLSAKMLKKAESKGIYKLLEKAEILDYLSRNGQLYSLIIAADVFVYVGDLGKVFKAVSSRLEKDGVFVFSTERLDSSPGFQLQETARYAHSDTYIRQVAGEAGLTVSHCQETRLRKDKGAWIRGNVYALCY